MPTTRAPVPDASSATRIRRVLAAFALGFRMTASSSMPNEMHERAHEEEWRARATRVTEKMVALPSKFGHRPRWIFRTVICPFTRSAVKRILSRGFTVLSMAGS